MGYLQPGSARYIESKILDIEEIKSAKVYDAGPGQVMVRIKTYGLSGLFCLPLVIRAKAQVVADASRTIGVGLVVKPSGLARAVSWVGDKING